MAVEENEGQGKQAKHQRVFFWFGDGLAVKDNSHRAVRLRHKPGRPTASTHRIIEGSRKKIADGFVQNAGAHPSRRLPAGIAQTAPGDTNPYGITKKIASVIQEKIGNGAAGAADGNRRRVGGAGGKGDVGFAAARYSRIHRSDVLGVRTGKQGRKRDRLVAGLVGVEDMPIAVVVDRLPRISIMVRPGGSDAMAATRGGGAAKNPDGLVGGVVLAGIDVDVKLRLALFNRRQRKQSCRQKKGTPPPPPQIACRLLRDSDSS